MNLFIYLGHQTIGRISLFHHFCRLFYLYLLIPALTLTLKKRHSNLIDLKIRNSINNKLVFNFFLSDIDSTLIIKNNSDSQALLKDFMFFKKFIIVLDYPQIYTISEFEMLENLHKKKSWDIVNLCWEIRKINRNLKSLDKDKSKINVIKINRSNDMSLKKILKSDKDLTKFFFLSDFNHLGRLFNVKPWAISLCYYANFLSDNDKYGMIIAVSHEQYAFFNSLLPYNDIDDIIKDQVSPEFLDCKEALQLFELLLLRSSLRLNNVLGEDTIKHNIGIKILEGLKDWGI